MAVPAFPQVCPHLCLKDARVQAFSAPLIDFPHVFRGGPVLEAEEHRIFRHDRGGHPADSFRPDETYPDALAGAYVYAGALYDHFGHFLAEMAHRIVPAQLLGLPARYLFVTTQGDGGSRGFEALPRFVREVLTFCGVSADQVVVIDRNTTVERLHLVRQGAALGIYPRPGYLDALAAYTRPRLDRLYAGIARPEKLYVSRSALPKTGSVLGECFVEARLDRAGFHIFRPERHGLTEQMDHYRKAQLIVFPGGSACHGTELLGTRMLGEVLLLPRIAGQAEYFRRVLKPRAIRFQEAEAALYLGSLLRDRASASESEHRGVSLFDLDRLARAGACLDPAFPKRLSLPGYAVAATRDLLAYGSEVGQKAPDRSETGKLALLARLLTQLWAMARRRSAGRPAPTEPAAPRVLGDREIAEIWAACASLPSPFAAFYRIAMLTLQQQPHLAGMRWSDLAPDRLLWTIPAERTGTGRAHRVHLSEPVRALLAGLPRAPGTDRVFHGNGKPIAGIARAKQALDAAILMARPASGGEPEPLASWSLFDLRRTGLLRLEEMGYEEAVIRSALALDMGPNEAMPPSAPAGTEAERARCLDAWAGEVVGRPLGGREEAAVSTLSH